MPRTVRRSFRSIQRMVGAGVVSDSLLVAEFFEQVVHVREVAGGHVFDEGAHELVVANAAVDPAEKNDELHQRRDGERPGVRFEEFEKLGHVVTVVRSERSARRENQNEMHISARRKCERRRRGRS